MMQQNGVLVKVPASTANLGPGFDTLGMALSLYTWIGMKPAETTVVRMFGPELGGLPADETNLIVQVAKRVFIEAGIEFCPLEIDVYSEIPLTRGLGSSASAIVGALVAANALLNSPLSDQQLFDMASAWERHPDNVGASLFGGIVVASWDGKQARHVRLEPHRSLGAVVAIPKFHLETKAARGVLPEQVSMADAVHNVSHSSLLVAALSTGQFELLYDAMQDRLHQPYRMSLVPGMKRVLEESRKYGAYGVALSGAGPTILALVNQLQSNDELVAFMNDTLQQCGVEADVFLLEPSSVGAACLEGSADDIYSLIPEIYRSGLAAEV
ncbi:homoserine kinase [Paenibacillus arenosi]|uniref:Homoserine kinase n=1 Tax=Paenibacillus arenosi TaxID=2774142 RepID=A0ABR9B5S3_9BACL|nr:homoserine kinase [Paenibacillus arenosi]MBD8500767.1 homoserine kinase [Paenibacillus arenosi]